MIYILNRKQIPHMNCRSAYLCSFPILFLLHGESEERPLLGMEDQTPKSYPQPANLFSTLCTSQKNYRSG